MITELKKQDFHIIKHITDKCRNIEVRAVVNGNSPGSVYVDHSEEPTAALIWVQGQEGFQIVGDARSESFNRGLEEYIRDYLEPKLKVRNIHWVEIGVDSDAWDSKLHAIFHDRNISSDIQHVFRITRGSAPIDLEHKNNELYIRRIDQNLLKSGRLANQPFLEKKILRFWDSIDSFFQQGFGYIAEINNNLVSVCFSAFVADQTHAIDIETLEGFRRKSYATAVAQAFMQECARNKIIPYWDCSPDNTGSIRLAEAIGLASSFDYKVFWYQIK